MNHKTMSYKVWIGALAFSVALGIGSARAQDQPVKPDNTRTNRDGGQTADQQAMNKGDRQLAAQIRKAVNDDKSLSTYAHNSKIIVQNGTVTLRGPVRTEEERQAVEAKAKGIAGVTTVNNELTVAPKQP
jgi:osmotically-inducible protein OsmY